MSDETVQLIRLSTQVVMWAGVALAVIVTRRFTYIRAHIHNETDRAAVRTEMICAWTAIAPIIGIPLAINTLAPVPMNWTLLPAVAVLGALSLVGLLVGSIKAGRQARERRSLTKMGGASLPEGRD